MVHVRLLAAACSFLFLLPPTVARAVDWEEAFVPAEAAGHVAQGAQVIVVPGGSGAEAAAAALTQALRDGDGASLVMDASGIGVSPDLADPEILDRVQHLPITDVLVVRVFPGGAGEATAVVSVYGKDKEVRTAFSVASGKKGGAPATEEEVGHGVSSQAATVVSALTQDRSQARADAAERYEREYLWLEEEKVLQMDGSLRVERLVPYRGKYKEPLEGRAFYDEVGRADLGDAYDARLSTARAKVTGGWIAFVGGLALITISPALVTDCAYNDDACNTANGVRFIGALGLGAVASTVGAFVAFDGKNMDPAPVTHSETRELADTHNRRLREELGLDPIRDRSAGLELGVGFGPHGGAVTVQGRF